MAFRQFWNHGSKDPRFSIWLIFYVREFGICRLKNILLKNVFVGVSNIAQWVKAPAAAGFDPWVQPPEPTRYKESTSSCRLSPCLHRYAPPHTSKYKRKCWYCTHTHIFFLWLFHKQNILLFCFQISSYTVYVPWVILRRINSGRYIGRLDANTMQFSIRDFSICSVWYL